MKLKFKLTSAFGGLAAITLVVSLFGLWQVHRLSFALYEVGAVRLPSIRGLHLMSDALHEIELSLNETSNAPAAVAAHLERQRRAWDQFRQGWQIYAPLPQTAVEAVMWRAFVPEVEVWQTESVRLLADLASARDASDINRLDTARTELATLHRRHLPSTSAQLADLVALNYDVAAAAKRESVASYHDMQSTRGLMILAAILSVLVTIGFGLVIGRRVSRPIVALADAFGKVASGDRHVKVEVGSNDEVAGMAHALNQMVDSLRTSDARLRLLGDGLPDSMLYQVVRESDGTMRFLHVSAGVERLHGLSAPAVLEDSSLLYRQILDEDRPALLAAEATSFATLTIFTAEARIRRPDGTVRWMQLCSQPRREADGRVVWDGLEFDITERKRVEHERQRAERALRTLSHCSHALVHATDELSLVRDVCRIIVEDGGYRLAWVGYAERDAQCTVRPVAHTGEASDYLRTLSVTWADEPRGRGPTGVAIRTGRPAVCQNFGQDPQVVPWRDEALRHGIQSSIVFPLTGERGVWGALSIYSGDPAAFDKGEFDLLAELASDLAYGIQSLRARALREHAEAEVRRLLAEADRVRGTLLSILEDHKLAQTAKERSEERYRNAMLNSAIGMAMVDPEGRWVEANPALCRIVGYDRAELLSRDFQSITHPDDLEIDQRMRQDLLDGKRATFELEKRYRHKSGMTVWVQLNGSLQRDEQGRPTHFILQIQDITARKQAEASLATASERLALALRVSQLGVWRHNLQTQASEWDVRTWMIFGLPPAPVAPSLEDILLHVADEDRPAMRHAWRALPTCRRSFLHRFRILRPDGRLRHLELQGIVHDDAVGRPEWTIGVVGDITEIVEATTESERLRTQLQQSQKMETLGTLAAGVAHDFNNLLTGINGFVELASTTLGPGHEAAELLQQARRGAMSARDLVRRILDYSRSNAERRRQRVDLAEVVRDTAPLIAAALPANLSLSLAIGCDTAPVSADSGQLQQILMNLCTNGAHAIGSASGRIQIGIEKRHFGPPEGPAPPLGCAPGHYFRLSVLDTGSGMDTATRTRIFEPFFTTKEPGKGTGLGLSIVRDIVVSHGGGIEVDSAPGSGTTFSILLPAAATGATATIPPASLRLAQGQGQRIMIVDDETSVAGVVRLTLQKHGYSPEVYSMPKAAWQRLETEAHAFDLLIVDLNMPEMSGSEFIARARSLVPSLPIILMSGRSDRLEAPLPPRVARLKKPFEIDDLLQTVTTTLEAVKAPRDPL